MRFVFSSLRRGNPTMTGGITPSHRPDRAPYGYGKPRELWGISHHINTNTNGESDALGDGLKDWMENDQ